jgi:CheY-like chemotaxis protein
MTLPAHPPACCRRACTKGRASGRSVLIVDDEPDFCEVIKEILATQGMVVRQAYSVDQAIESLRAEAPDLVLTDVMMPETDGLTLVRSLRAEPGWRKIPTVVVSARVQESDAQAAINAGADAFLAKPFSIRQLRAVLEPLLPAY